MNEEGAIQVQTGTATRAAKQQNDARPIFSAAPILWAALAAVIMVGFAASEVGRKAADKRWEDMLVGSGLVTPEVAAKVRAECWTKRREFEKSATMRRWLQAENERVRRAPAQLTAQPAAGTAKATQNTEPKREEP